MNSNLTLRPATLADLDAVMFIERIAFETPWTTEMIRNSLEAPYSFVILENARSKLVGYSIAINLAQECQLLNIVIHPEQQGKQYGRFLLQSVLHEALTQGAKEAFLEVRISNQGAIALYQTEGFKTIGTRRGYYETRKGGREDALVMRYIYPL